MRLLLRLAAAAALGAALVAALQLLAETIGVLHWLQNYCCGNEDAWSLNIATATWVTAGAAAVAVWASARRDLALGFAAAVGTGVTGLLLVRHQSAQVDPNPPTTLTRLSVMQLVAVVAGALIGVMAARTNDGTALGAPIALLFGFAVVSQALGNGRPSLALITGGQFGEDLHRTSMYAATAIATFGVMAWAALRHRSTATAGLVFLTTFAFVVLAFRTAGIDQSPDHSTATTPDAYAHRLFLSAVIATLLSAVAALAVTRRATGAPRTRVPA
jgi:hypothetical protein